jgi:hypothetical protein
MIEYTYRHMYNGTTNNSGTTRTIKLYQPGSMLTSEGISTINKHQYQGIYKIILVRHNTRGTIYDKQTSIPGYL